MVDPLARSRARPRASVSSTHMDVDGLTFDSHDSQVGLDGHDSEDDEWLDECSDRVRSAPADVTDEALYTPHIRHPLLSRTRN